MKRLRGRASLAAIALVSAIIVPTLGVSIPASAAPPGSPCASNPVEQDTWRANNVNNVAITGVAATLNMPPGISVCIGDSSPNNLVASNVSITTAAGGDMEVGYIFYYGSPGSCTRSYSKVTAIAGGITNTVIGGCMNAGNHFFHMEYVATCSCEKLYVDTTLMDQTGWNPATTYPWNSFVWRSQLQSYITDLANNLIGTLANPQVYSSVAMEIGVSTSWTDACSVPTAPYSRFADLSTTFFSRFQGYGISCDSATTYENDQYNT